MRPIGALLTLILLSPALAGCLGSADEAPDVLATFYPLAFLAERIGGDNVTVGTLVPTGVEPHDWEPSPRDLAHYAKAKVVLAQGIDFEPWLAGVRSQLTTDTTVITTSEVTVRTETRPDGTPGSADPHTWLDPVTFQVQAHAVERALATAFPEHAAAFATRTQALVADLDAVHLEFQQGLETCETRFIIATHDAYGYLSDRYDIEVNAISGLTPEAEPDPRTIADLVDLAREHNVTIIYFEELVSDRVARIIAEEVGAQTRVLSPIEGLTSEASSEGADYVTLMRDNLANLREGMRCT